jgi:hypothetical protein
MDSAHRGNTGEFYVLAELSRRGWIAAQTSRNARAFDILARNGGRQVAIRVKTTMWKESMFRWNVKKNGEIFSELGPNDYSVLVEIPEAIEQYPVFYIVPSRTIESWLTADYDTWVRTPGMRGQPHDPSNKVRLFYLDGDDSKIGRGYRGRLEPYLQKWDILEGNE